MTLARMLIRLRRDRRAGTAMIFGISLVPLILMAGFAVDYSGAIAMRSRLKAATDAALLTTVASAVNIYRINPLATPADYAVAAADGAQRFNAQLGATTGMVLTPPSISVVRAGGTFTASAAYLASYDLRFAGVLGRTSMDLGGSADMVVTTSDFVDVQLLMDVSGSMLIGGTADDITALQTATKDSSRFAYPSGWWSSCAFACHWDQNGTNDYYNFTRKPDGTARITLRIDQLKQAAAAMATALDAKNVNHQYRLGLFTFSTADDTPQWNGWGWGSPNNYYTTATVNYDLTNDVAGLIPTIKAIPPTLGDPWHAYDTDITGAVTKFANTILMPGGTGGTAATPRKFTFILTDGLDDHICNGPEQGFVCDGSNRIQVPVQTRACDALKKQGAVVGVIHTALWEGTDNYNAVQTQAQINLQACATNSSMYFSVTDQASIDAAMQALLNIAVATPAHFTQ